MVRFVADLEPIKKTLNVDYMMNRTGVHYNQVNDVQYVNVQVSFIVISSTYRLDSK